MRAVVDTNVIISAALSTKSSPHLALRLVERRGRLLKSTATEKELLQVLMKPKLTPLIAPIFHEWISGLLANAESVPIIERITVCRDPGDDRFLELAMNGNADIIISGDDDLLVLNSFRGIPIVQPADFVQHAGRIIKGGV